MPALVARMLGETRTTTVQPEALDALPSGLFRTVGAASAVRAAARAVAGPAGQEEGRAVLATQEAGQEGITPELLDLGFEEAEAEAGGALEECVVSSPYSCPHSICCVGHEAAFWVSVNFILIDCMHCVCLSCSGLQRGARGGRGSHVAAMLPCVP